MNKQDTIIVVLLFAGLMGWFFVQGRQNEGQVPGEQPAQAEVSGPASAVEPVAPAAITDKAEDPAEAAAEAVAEHSSEETVVRLSNEDVELDVSSWGACVKGVKLLRYREYLEEDSEPVYIEFSDSPALALRGVAGFSRNADFKVVEQSVSNVVFEAASGPVTLRRAMELGDGYQVRVRDTFLSEESAAVPPFSIDAGTMTRVSSKSSVKGIAYISIDSLAMEQGAKVVHWSKKKDTLENGRSRKLTIEERIQPDYRQGASCSMFRPKLREMLPESVKVAHSESTQWVAVKNKFFLSILSPLSGSDGLELGVKRQKPDGERQEDMTSWIQNPEVESVSARMTFGETPVSPEVPVEVEYTYYCGPKKYDELRKLGKSFGEIMEFGFWAPLSRLLLNALNAMNTVVRNYGVSIILLTILVRLVFWPVTHKSTESMKRMQEIQPEVKKLQEKFKDNPAKLNQATMALYKERKVNPMAGCLPLLIQIPVFFALFTVLRSAVELRFADFLWIRDLSEQEGLLAGLLPIPLNILPLVMTGLTVWQQKLTPSAGDPQQQKMMMLMPIMFLFLFYPMPSALVLYWTTSQLIALAQLILQRRRSARQAAV